MTHTIWTGYELLMLAAVIGMVRFALRLPAPGTEAAGYGRTLIRIGAVAALIEAVLWLLGVYG